MAKFQVNKFPQPTPSYSCLMVQYLLFFCFVFVVDLVRFLFQARTTATLVNNLTRLSPHPGQNSGVLGCRPTSWQSASVAHLLVCGLGSSPFDFFFSKPSPTPQALLPTLQSQCEPGLTSTQWTPRALKRQFSLLNPRRTSPRLFPV